MDVKVIDLPKPSQLVEAYIASSPRLTRFFDYDYNKNSSYQARFEELCERTYKRDELVSLLTDFNKTFGPHPNVTKNIKRLADQNAVVVVGGQQAGLLTGPVYTIHKCLSILHFAKAREEELNVPVIPVFWIAGEDHDFAEVNHVHVYADHVLRKMAYQIKGSGQFAVSDLAYNSNELENWVENVFKAFGETDFTRTLLNDVKEAVRNNQTLVGFFAHLIHDLFGKYGLVLMDSGDHSLRKLESDYFVQMIQNSREIAAGVTSQLAELSEAGYSVNLDQTPKSANLFFTKDDQRILLSREEDLFINSEKGLQITKNELIDLAHTHPEALSNNVVTRPLMQDLVLPTLAFIAGPGEIAYWSALKPAFNQLAIKMPPVVPRLHITLVDRQSEKWLNSKSMGLEDALNGKIQSGKEAWLGTQHDWQLENRFEETKQAIWNAYLPYREIALAVHGELEKISTSNWERIELQLAYLKKQMERHIRLAHKSELDRFDAIEVKLLPNGGPQERIWTVYTFINEYGPDLVDRLMEGNYEFNGRQHAVYL